jgi:hypothetical protein
LSFFRNAFMYAKTQGYLGYLLLSSWFGLLALKPIKLGFTPTQRDITVFFINNKKRHCCFRICMTRVGTVPYGKHNYGPAPYNGK